MRWPSSAYKNGMATKNKEPRPAITHAIDSVLGELRGEQYGFSLCGIFSHSLVEDRKLVTCRNCLKRLATKR